MQTRLSSAGVDPAIVGRALTPADLETRKVTDGQLTGESGTASFLLAYAMGFLLYFGIFFYGQQTATSVIEEKNSRIMEVLASSLTPFQMLLGKIVGVGLTGLLQLAIWGGVMFIALSRRAQIAGLFGADPATVAALPLPSFPSDLLVIFLLYFVLGFMIYGALFAAVGSMVNTVQEMQQFLFPVMMLIIFAFLGMFAVLKDPTAGIGVTFSFIPFFAPIVMPVRWSMASVPIGQLVLSLTGMVVGVLAVAWLAGRIYRTGILMYGKKPTVREVFRWIKAG
jgi:ABC-2 type transport system permease protein